MYAPIVSAARPVRQHQIDENHTGVLLADITAEGSVRYAFLLPVFRRGEQDPVIIVSSELTATADELAELLGELDLGPEVFEPDPDDGSHFLCAFVPSGHQNFGASDDWGDEVKFEARALALARQLIAE